MTAPVAAERGHRGGTDRVPATTSRQELSPVSSGRSS